MKHSFFGNSYQIVDFKFKLESLQVVRQRRSKSFFISDYRQMSSGKPSKASTSLTTFCRSTMVSASASSSSCVSTDSGITSAQSLAADRVIRGKRNSQLTKELNPKAPPYLRRRAEAILRVLSHGSISEIRIRQLIGNSPDTSKALRMWAPLSLFVSFSVWLNTKFQIRDSNF